VGDVGEVTWEELDTLVSGGNYGWNTYEGPCLTNVNCNPDPNPPAYPADLEYPIHFYNHSGAGETGRTVIAGAFAENGSNYPAPYGGAYFYGDFSANWVHVLTMEANNNTVTGRLDFATLTQPVCFRNGEDGNVYVLTLGG